MTLAENNGVDEKISEELEEFRSSLEKELEARKKGARDKSKV